mgnify:FL=1
MQADGFNILQWRGIGDGLEVLVQTALTHAGNIGQGVDIQWLGKVGLDMAQYVGDTGMVMIIAPV